MAALLEGHISVVSVTDGHKFILKMLKQRTIKRFTGVQNILGKNKKDILKCKLARNF